MFQFDLLNSAKNTPAAKRDWGPMELRPYLTPVMAIALSFGYAIGWGAFIMPGTIFLPKAGPLGTIIGLFAASLVILHIAWCYHIVAVKAPGSGAAFTITNTVFGSDHAFLMSWFLSLTYIAILWANASAIALLARLLFGDLLQFGFLFNLAGFNVYLGEAILSMLMIFLAGMFCLFSKRVAATIQTILVAIILGVVFLCFLAALAKHTGGLASMAPAFSTDGKPLKQIFHIFALAPWAFVGFEAITNSSNEYSFPVRRTFSILTTVLVIAVVMFICLTLLPVLVFPSKYADWYEYIRAIRGISEILGIPVFTAAKRLFGGWGTALVGTAMLAGQFTGLVGTFIAASRLLFFMAKAGIAPKRFGLLDQDASPRNAILLIMLCSLCIPLCGYSLVTRTVEIASLGATIAYGYTAAAAYKLGHRVAGVTGLLLSVVFSLFILLPNHLTNGKMTSESYIMLAAWTVLGCVFYRVMFKHDTNRRIGQSIVVSVKLFLLILFACVMWNIRTFEEHTDDFMENVQHSKHRMQRMKHEMRVLKRSMTKSRIGEGVLLLIALSTLLNLNAILRKREQKLLQEKARLEDINKAKSYFFSTVSHDIRTPLNAIIGFSQMLKSGFKTEDEKNMALDSILVSSKTLLNLINDVLDLSKLEAGKMDITPTPTVCSKLVHEIVESFKLSNKKPDLEIRGNVEDMPPLMLDAQRIRQIIFNLAGNAIKFTTKGHVEIKATYKGGTFRLQVEDTGQGISQEDLARIASPYVQLTAKNSRNGGTGLGLAISRQLAAAMGGRLEIASTLGVGSTFAIVIPNVKVSENQSLSDTVIIPKISTSAQKYHRLLLVDDQKMNLMVLKAMLKKMGTFDIVTAENGKEALEKLEAQGDVPFDLVLTDMWMPEMDGEGLIRAIRAKDAYKDLAVYALTADIETTKTHERLGFTGILLKPITMEALKDILV